jgi:hypothetical protein
MNYKGETYKMAVLNDRQNCAIAVFSMVIPLLPYRKAGFLSLQCRSVVYYSSLYAGPKGNRDVTA